jgi:hypothetical protein
VEQTQASVLNSPPDYERRNKHMIEESATRFNNGDWYHMKIDTEIPSCEVTGFIDGQPVDFSGGGGGELTFAMKTKKLSAASNVIKIDNIPEEPKCFALITTYASSLSMTEWFIANYVKFGDKSIITQFQPSTGKFQNVEINITETFADNRLTLTSDSIRFSAIESYTLVYAY